ncbi:MAG: hypothetical protein K1X79_13140 [Oligoflexia bacterium]|nr:hypothetical protein [Oligoflexia bacterium]
MNDESTQSKSALWLPFGVHDFFLLIGLAALLLNQLNHFADDPGLGWHLKTGQWIWQHGAVPALDPFLADLKPRPWVADQWLGSLCLWAMYSWGGWPLLYASVVVLYVGTYFVLLYRGLSAALLAYIPATLAALIAFKVGEIHLIARPVVFGFFFFAAVYSLMLNAAQHLSGARTSPRFNLGDLCVVLPVIFAFWANIHPSFILGLLYLYLVLLGLWLDRALLGRQSLQLVSASVWKQGLLLAVLCGLATLINPYGIRLHQSILSLAGSEFFMRYHQEWLSPDFKSLEGVLTEVVLVIVVASMFLSRRLRETCGLVDLLPFFAFLHLGLGALRVLPFFAIAASGLVVKALSALPFGEWVERSQLFTSLTHRLRRFEFFELRSPRGIAAFSVLAVLLLGDSLLNGRLLVFEGPYGPSQNAFPYAAMEALADLHAESEVVPIVAPSNWGGFISLAGWPRLRAVIDDRNALLGEQFYKDFDDQLQVGKDWKSYTAGLGARYLLWPTASALVYSIKQTHALFVVHEDPVATVFDLGSDSPDVLVED